MQHVRISGIVVGVVLGSACGGHKASQPMVQEARAETEPLGPLNAGELMAFRTCSSDADCVLAQNGCCDCANGGEDVAVSSSQLAEFKARFDCVRAPCTMRAAVPACGSGSVSCLEELCTYTPPPSP